MTFRGYTVRQPIVITEDTLISLETYGRVLSFSLKNQGSSDAILNDSYNLLSGSPMASFLGTDGYLMKDILKIKFTGGTGNLLLYLETVVQVFE
jgi:hypothetical protein